MPPYAPWRRLLAGEGPVLVVVGPLAGGLLEALRDQPACERPELWVLAELPLAAHPLPAELVGSLEAERRLCVVEEHVAWGSAGAMLVHALLEQGIGLEAFVHLRASGYPSGRYGSQAFHRRECGLDAASVLKRVAALREAP